MKRILVIEDETAINELICMNLEIAGYKPVPFFDGAKFSTHLKQEDAYDLAGADLRGAGVVWLVFFGVVFLVGAVKKKI